MNIDVNKKDLIHMICGTSPSYEYFDTLREWGVGHYVGGFNDKWVWDPDSLDRLSEYRLEYLYQLLTDEDEKRKIREDYEKELDRSLPTRDEILESEPETNNIFEEVSNELAKEIDVLILKSIVNKMKVDKLNERIKELMLELMNAKKKGDSKEEIELITTELNVVKSIKDKFVNFDKGDKAVNIENYGSDVLNDDVEKAILIEMKNGYEKAIEKFTEANATELLEQYKTELGMLIKYMPAPATTEEITKYTEEILDGMENVAMNMTKDVISKVQEKYPEASGKLISSIVKTRSDILPRLKPLGS